MTPTAVLVEFFFTEWIEINEYLINWKKRKNNNIYCWYVHSFKNLWSSIFDCTPLVISTMLPTSLSMPEKGNISISKQKHSFSQGAFVCKHENLSEHFEVVCTEKDGLRWVIFSPENVGQLISYYHISATFEHIYPEKQQNNSKKDNGSIQMEGDDASRWNAG